MENQNRFDPLANGSGTKASQTGSDKNKFISGLKFVSININSIRGKKLGLLAFFDFHQPQIVTIQETKIDSSISTSELFPESYPYNVYRKDRTLDGGGVMLLINNDISHMPITELENDSESTWVKVFANKTSHFVACWYRPPGGNLEISKSQLTSFKSQWTLANISPLFKKADRSLACNYRPVSLTCVPCKLLEHIVCSNIMSHLEKHKLLSDKQHAFRKWHSCETQLATVINDYAKILDNKGQVDTFILDFEKAFDTPPHELLKSKLFSYGIGGKTLKWINAFLCFRQSELL